MKKQHTNEVINRLLLLLGDTNDRVRSSACNALEKMGEKAAISKVVGVLSDARWDDEFGMRGIVGKRSGKLFDWLPCMPNLEGDIDKKKNTWHGSNCWFLRNRFPEEFIRVFLHTKRSFWLPIIARLSIRKGIRYYSYEKYCSGVW